MRRHANTYTRIITDMKRRVGASASIQTKSYRSIERIKPYMDVNKEIWKLYKLSRRLYIVLFGV